MKRLTLEDLLYMQDKVIEWNKLFGNEVNDKSLIDTYHKLTVEEFTGKGEFVESFDKGNAEGQLDGLVDTVFTGFFWANLNSSFISDNFWYGTGEWKGLCNSTSLEYDILCASSCLLDEKDTESFLCLFTLILYKMSEKYDIIGAFNRILESNTSKAVSKSSGICPHECCDAVVSAGRYSEVFFEEKEDFYIIKAHRDLSEDKYYEQGKIVKSTLWYESVEDLGGLGEFIYE